MKEPGINKVAVIGAGLMGFGIGVEFARFGYDVSLYNTSEASSKRTQEWARDALDLMAETELITADEAEGAYSRLQFTTDLVEAATGADYVAESVLEDLKLKREVFTKLDEICPPPAILTTNSSRFRSSEIHSAVKHPERVLNAHYFQPPHFIPLVEVVGGELTARENVEKTASILRGLRKRVVVIDIELPSFAGNRIQGAIGREIQALVDQGVCTPEMIDDIVMYGFGRRMAYTGYFIRQDLIGLDFPYGAAKARGDEPWKEIAVRVERGDLGMKSGKGFYDWPGDSAKQLHRGFNKELIRLMKRDMEQGAI